MIAPCKNCQLKTPCSLVNGGLLQTLRKGISTMDEDGFIGKDEVVMQVERGSLWMECSIPKKRVTIFQDFWKVQYLVTEFAHQGNILKTVIYDGSRLFETKQHSFS